MLSQLIFTLVVILAILIVGGFIAIALAWLFIQKKIMNTQNYTNISHVLNLAIKDLTLNLWFSHELMTNGTIPKMGTYARYWFDGMKSLNLSIISDVDNYAKIMHIIHLMDVDNRKLDNGDFRDVVNHATTIQSNLLEWIPFINETIIKHELKIPLLPKTMLEQIKQSYEEQGCN